LVAAPSSFPSVAFVSGGREAAKARYSASSLQGSHQGLQQQQSSARGGATPVLRMFQHQAQARRSTSTGVLQTKFAMRITRHKSQNKWNAEFNYIRRVVRKGSRAVQSSRAILFAYMIARSEVQCTFYTVLPPMMTFAQPGCSTCTYSMLRPEVPRLLKEDG
jgi:hypothetical protein